MQMDARRLRAPGAGGTATTSHRSPTHLAPARHHPKPLAAPHPPSWPPVRAVPADAQPGALPAEPPIPLPPPLESSASDDDEPQLSVVADHQPQPMPNLGQPIMRDMLVVQQSARTVRKLIKSRRNIFHGLHKPAVAVVAPAWLLGTTASLVGELKPEWGGALRPWQPRTLVTQPVRGAASLGHTRAHSHCAPDGSGGPGGGGGQRPGLRMAAMRWPPSGGRTGNPTRESWWGHTAQG